MYEIWVARDLNLVGKVTEQECVVYDLATGEKDDVRAGQVWSLDDVSRASVGAFMEGCLGFTFAGVPSDATWNQASVSGNLHVYELGWMRKTYAGRDMPVKYEVVVNTTTMLPVSLRMFCWDALEMSWECGSVIVLEYLSD